MVVCALAFAGRGADALAGVSDAQIAKRSVLTMQDLPQGWKRVAASKQMKVKCPAFVAAREDASALAKSPDATMGANAEVATAVYVYAGQAAATGALTAMNGADSRRCYADKVAKTIRGTKGFKLRRVRTADLALDAVGDQRAAVRFTFSITAKGVDADVYIDLVFARTGRGLSVGGFSDAGTPFDKTLRTQLIAKQTGRLADAIG
jgi:hypothetical protein